MTCRECLEEPLVLSVPNDFATIQEAVNYIYTVDTMGYSIDIQLADATYNESVLVDRLLVGSGMLRIKGNPLDPLAVYLIGGLQVYNGGYCTLTDLKVRSDNSCLSAYDRGRIDYGNLIFTTTLLHHIQASSFGLIRAISDYSIAAGGGAQSHIHSFTHGLVCTVGRHLTFIGGCLFSKWFVGVSNANVSCEGMTFSGPGFAGKRFRVHANGLIDTNTGNELFFPGTLLGTKDTGGQYE